MNRLLITMRPVQCAVSQFESPVSQEAMYQPVGCRLRQSFLAVSGLATVIVCYTVKIGRHLTTKILTTFSSEKNDDKPLSVDDTFFICDNRFVT